MFRTSGDPVILDTPDIPTTIYLACQIRVLGRIIKVVSTQGTALDVQSWPQQDARALAFMLIEQEPSAECYFGRRLDEKAQHYNESLDLSQLQ